MSDSQTSQRKKDHIKLCLTDQVGFKTKTNGFENYEFEHFAATEIQIDKINLAVKFFSKKVNLPFLISCMTGGTGEAQMINEKLALAAKELNIPVGVGSQRQALENNKFHSTYKTVRRNAGNIPILGNIGAAQVAKSKKILDEVRLLVDLVEADAMTIHLNPLQELMQKEGETDFKGLLKNIEKLCAKLGVPIIIKEVGAGINKFAARMLLNAGVDGIDIAGVGGTNWAAVELLRNDKSENILSEWGLPTSYCLRRIFELKKKYKFMLISSGGITNGVEIAKSLALGADFAASARPVLVEVVKNDVQGVIDLINSWFKTVKNIMYLTGSSNIKQLRKGKLIRKTVMY